MKKTHLSDLENREGIMVKKGEGVFTGKAWSSDDKTICLECETGRPTSLYIYYEDGKLAGKAYFKGDNIFDQDVDGVFFDKDGNPVDDDKFLDSEDGKEVFQKVAIYFRELSDS